MSQASERLVGRISELEESNDELREKLLHHKRALRAAAQRVKSGELTPEAIRSGGAPEIRVDLTDALAEFERARHQVRLALFAFLGLEQDTSTAEIGRSLGFSRQLASRLAQEAKESL
jgi:hypothetical protein